MITHDATFDAANAKKVNEPVWLAKLEKDYLAATLTDYNDWKDGSTEGDGGPTDHSDIESNKGALQMGRVNVDILSSVSGLGDSEVILLGTENNYTTEVGESLFCRLVTFFDTELKAFKISAKRLTGKVPFTFVRVLEISDTIGSRIPTSGFEIREIAIDNEYVFWDAYGTSYADVTFTFTTPVNLLAGRTYLIEFTNGAFDTNTVYVQQWIPNDDVFQKYKGFQLDAIQLGQILKPRGTIAEAYVYDLETDFLNGEMWIKYLLLTGFESGSRDTYASAWYPVKNQAGTPTTPTVSGELRLSTVLPNGTAVSVQVWGNASGVDAGHTDLGTIADGGTVAAYAYYKFIITMTTTRWSATPIVQGIQVYFGIFENIVFSSDQFNNYQPLLADIPSFDSSIDPLACKSSLSEAALEIAIKKKGYNLSEGWIETFITGYKVLELEMRLFFGFREITEDHFIEYQRGVLYDYVPKEQSVVLKYRDNKFLLKDPLKVDINTNLPPIFYNNENIIDVLLDLEKRFKPLRLINQTSFTGLKTARFSEWKVLRPITETIEEAKTLSDELCELAGCVIVEDNTGKSKLIYLFDETTGVSATFTEGENYNWTQRCQFNFDKRINKCAVRSGYWDTSTNTEAIDKYYKATVHEQSILDTGVNKEKIIENKWLPLNSLVGTEDVAQLVANRFVEFFAYGIWILKGETSNAFAYLQEGDYVNVVGSQILYKGITNPSTKRGVIIKKENFPDTAKLGFTIFLIKPLTPTIPANAPTSMSFTSLSTSGMTVNFTKGSGADGTIVLMKGYVYPSSVPVAGVVYYEGYIMPDGSTVVYLGTGSSKAVTGLDAQSNYFFRAFAYNAAATNYNFKTDATLDGNQYTNSTEPANHCTNLVLTVMDNTSIKIDWDAPTGGADQYLVLYRATSDVADVPTDANGYTAGGTIGTSTVGHSGTARTVTLTGLTNGTTYYVKVFPFNGFNNSQKNYKTDGTPLAGNKVCAVVEPTAQITSFTLEAVFTPKRTCNLTWVVESPRATGIIILGKSGAISDSPSDSTVYTVGETIGSSKVIFVGDSSIAHKEYTSDTFDNFKAFTYNGITTPNYFLTSAPTATEV